MSAARREIPFSVAKRERERSDGKFCRCLLGGKRPLNVAAAAAAAVLGMACTWPIVGVAVSWPAKKPFKRNEFVATRCLPRKVCNKSLSRQGIAKWRWLSRAYGAGAGGQGGG